MATVPYGASRNDGLNPDAQDVSRRGGTWLLSLTGVCFIFGMVLAMQLRAQQKVQEHRERDTGMPLVAQNEIQNLRSRLEREGGTRAGLQGKINSLQKELASTTASSGARSKQLQTQMQELQMAAGLTTVRGPGIVVSMTDNPQAAKSGGGSPFLPGIVHDFDLLQIVNELRSAKAEAIAIQGADALPIRITGFTPIRCVGPVIYVNGDPVATPFRVQAIGNPETLASALKMAGGIVDKLSGLFPIKVRQVGELKLPAMESPPKMRVAKAG